jgi:hypothetical protein
MLLILTPFISFVNHDGYSYTTPEILICLAGLAAVALLVGFAGMVGGWPARVVLTAGLLVLFVDIQFDWLDRPNPAPEFRVIGAFVLALILSFAMRRPLSRIVTAVFGIMLASTVVLASVENPASQDSRVASAASGGAMTSTDPSPSARPPLPILVHLMLDEHIGVEGTPEDVPHGREMRKFLREFFDTYGFRLFARAYSRYTDTQESLPNLVNFASEPVQVPVGPYVLVSNRYFELLSRAGYNIHVYQSSYIDFCTVSEKYTVHCSTWGATGFRAIEPLNIPVSDKVTLIYRRFADLSALKAAAEVRYTYIRQVLHSAGWTLPEWWFKEGRLGPLPQMPLFDVITADVARASPGDMFFAHLLNPHNPYVYDATCHLRPVRDWEHSRNPGPPWNDRESRARRYGLYLEQMRCLYRKLDAMFQVWQKAGIFDRLAIVVHSDHGSKIYQRRPRAADLQKLSHADYLDSFSTLFAVKGPHHAPAYDRRVAAIQQLLWEVVSAPTGDDDTQAEPYVFLPIGPTEPMVRQPLLAFGDGQ